MASGKRIGIFGATGHTGRFVAAEVQRRGIEAVWIGRDGAALDRLRTDLGQGEIRMATSNDANILRRAFDGLEVVINCAGPFLETGAPVMAAAIEAGCHALDVTAEQAAVLETIGTFDEPAKNAGRAIVPAMAFFGGLADLLVTDLVGKWSSVDMIETAVALNFWHPTAGTRATGERNRAARLVVKNGALVPMPIPAPTTAWRFPKPFGMQEVVCVPLSETILIARHIRVATVMNYMARKPLADLADETTPPPTAADALGRSDQRFVLSGRVRLNGEVREARVTGRDIYAVTAPLVVEAACRLLSGTTRLVGVRTAGELFDAADFLDSLSDVLSHTRSM